MNRRQKKKIEKIRSTQRNLSELIRGLDSQIARVQEHFLQLRKLDIRLINLIKDQGEEIEEAVIKPLPWSNDLKLDTGWYILWFEKDGGYLLRIYCLTGGGWVTSTGGKIDIKKYRPSYAMRIPYPQKKRQPKEEIIDAYPF